MNVGLQERTHPLSSLSVRYIAPKEGIVGICVVHEKSLSDKSQLFNGVSDQDGLQAMRG